MTKTFKISLLIIIILNISFSLFAVDKLKSYSFFGRKYINIQHLSRRYSFLMQRSGEKLLVRGKHHRFSFVVNKKFAEFNDVKILLSHAVYAKSGAYYLSVIDYNSVVLPLLTRLALRKHQVKTIFIDPGHGGKDNGAEGNYYKEKHLALKLSAKVSALLKKYNYRVIMSRYTDRYLTLKDRVYLANKSKADLFLSIHFNATTNRSVYGVECFALTPAGAASTNSSKIDYKSYFGNRNDRNNFILTYLTQRGILRYTKATDRGVKHARFFVIKDITMPGVLIEAGFLTNPSSERIVSSEAYLTKTANGIVSAVINYTNAVR